MRQLDLLSNPRMGRIQPHRLRAFLASCVFHGLALGSLAALTLAYRSHLPPPKSGSAAGAPSLSLETMVIVSPPPQPPAPEPPKAAPAVDNTPTLPSPTVAVTTPPREPEAKPAPAEATVPVLAIQPSKPMQAPQSKAAKIRAATHPANSPAAVATAQSPSKPAAAAACSSYAPGPNDMPHPPYPTKAQDRGQTGTVVMNVYFDAKGDVAQVEVTQSSGAPILDSETQSFVRARWHCPAYAGQIKNETVLYQLK
jgi:protein TonB